MSEKYLHFSLTLLIFLLTSVVQQNNSLKLVKDDGKGSLVFVFDTTGSMFNDLRQLREGAEMILKTAMEDSHVIADFVFVPFHDPGVGPATVTKNKEVFKKALASVRRLYGGGNCPEMSLTGIQLALNVSRPHSFLYVFTDATAYDHKLVGKVLDGVQRKQSQVVFVLTGHCNDLDKPTFKVYQQIAAASSGQVFNLNKTSVHKVLDFVRSSLKGRTVNLVSAVNPAGYNYTQKIPVDKSVGEVTVSVSGSKPQIRVVSPNGEQLTGPPRLVTTLDLSEIMIVKVLKPEPGNWSITVGSEKEHSVRVVGLSNLTFQHGFSVQPSASMDETSYRPLKGTYNHMLLSLNGTESPIRMDKVQLLSLDGKPLFEVPLKELDRERKIYQADAFVPPDDFFNIAVIGRDENGQEVRRMGYTAVQAKPPDAPYLLVTPKINARAHTLVKLSCHVESLVPLSATWIKDGVQLLPKTHALQSTSIEYVVKNMSEGYVGAYQCAATNSAGTSTAKTLLDMIVDPPEVTVLPGNVSLLENDTLTLTCSVYSEALLQRSQIVFNGTLQSYATDIHLEPSLEGYYTYNQTIQQVTVRDSGIYTCVAVNRGGKTNQSSYVRVQSKPTTKILGQQNIVKTINSDVQVVCNVENAERVQWLNINNDVVKEYVINGSHTAVLDVKNITEDSAWTCLATKDSLKASDTVKLTVVIKPQVTIENRKNITVLNGTKIEVICTVIAKPAPNVTWLMEPKKTLTQNVTNPEPNLFRNVLTLDSTNESINGTYICIAQNSEGIDNNTIAVKVKRKMTVLQGFSDTAVELYSQIDFHCLIDSDTDPNITWYHNGTTLVIDDNINVSDDNTIINIQKVDFDDLGLYVCETDNGYEKMVLNGTLSVHGLEKPILLKEKDKVATIKETSAILTCRVLKGNPEPNIKWQYKQKESANFTSLPENVIVNEENNIKIQNVTKNNAGIYQCIAENIMGKDTYKIEFIVQYPPELNESQEIHSEHPKEVQAGEKMKLICNVTGLPPPMIIWTKDGLPMTYSSNVYLNKDNNLIIVNVTTFDSGLFTCNASSTLGFVLKNFTITVYEYPEIVHKPDIIPEVEVVEGQLVELPCNARGVPTPEIVWLQNGEVVNDARKYVDEYGLRFVANLTDFGEYTCLASNVYGNASINYTVLIWVPPSIQPPLEVYEEVQAGTDASFECNAIGFPIPTIAWAFGDELLTHNSTDLSFNDSGDLNIKNASSKHNGPFVCIAENMVGSANKIFYVRIKELPRILEDNSMGSYEATNLDRDLTISCKAVGNPKPYVAWIKDGFYLNTDNHYVISADGTLTMKQLSEELSGVYTCIAKNSAGNATRDIPVRIYSVPVLMQEEGSPVVTTAVEGTNVELQCPVRGSDYAVKWYKDAILISNESLKFPNVSRTKEATYTCVASNAAGSVHTNVALRVQWSPEFLTRVNESIEVIKGNDYYLDCKTDAKPRAKTKWLFNSKTLLGENRDMLKLLNVELRHSGIYRCVGSNEHGTVPKQFNISVVEPPFISEFGLLDVQLKAGANATLECSAKGSPKPNVTWAFNNTNWTIQKNTLIATNVSSKSEGRFKCEARNRAGFTHVVYRVIVVSAARVEDIVLYKDGEGTDVGNSLDLVLNTKVRIACKASGNPKPIIQWIRHGNTVSENTEGINYADMKFDNVTTSHAGPYTCIAANEGGIDERIIKVNVLEPPRIFQTLFQNANTSQNVIELEVISGQAFYLHCHPYGNPLPEIYWFKDGLTLKLYDETMVSKEYGEVLVSRNAKYEQSGNYTCVARNKVGDTSVVYLVDVLVPPPLHKDNEKQAKTLVGKALNLTCPAEGWPIPYVMWVKHPYTEIIESQRIHLLNDNFTMIIPDPEISDSGKYSCIMSNKVGSTELVYDVTIEKPPSIAGNKGEDTAEDHVVPLRRSIVLKCEVDGHPQPKITWFKDVQQLSNNLPHIQRVLGSSLVGLWSVDVGDAGQYICVAENGVGIAHRRYNLAVQVPGKWSTWSAWSYCNATCGLGHQQRSRHCQYIDDYNNTIDKNTQPLKWVLDESSCKGSAEDRRKCHMPPCEEVETASKWSAWSKWSRCSTTCGSGTQARSRRCKGSQPCGGDNVQIRKCPGLPKCSGTTRRSDKITDGHTISETNPEYIPEATIEMRKENINEKPSAKYTDIYIPTATMQSFYKVIVKENLDQSDRGPCEPGYTYIKANETCKDIDECLIDNNQCHLTQVCGNSLGGYVCSCPEGYASLGAGQRCLDINECMQDTHGCEYACVNVAGGYVCACPAHLRLHLDKHRCVPPSLYRKPDSYEDVEEEDYLSSSYEHSWKHRRTNM